MKFVIIMASRQSRKLVEKIDPIIVRRLPVKEVPKVTIRTVTVMTTQWEIPLRSVRKAKANSIPRLTLKRVRKTHRVAHQTKLYLHRTTMVSERYLLEKRIGLKVPNQERAMRLKIHRI